MPFVYLILLIIALIKWLLPYIIIGIVSYVVLVLLVHLFKKVKETKKEFWVHKNENEFSKQQIYSTNSFTISQIIAGLLNHAIQQEKAENEKMLSNLQIRAREQAHILHNNGQFEEEIEFIKKEMESCDLNGSYYRYWDSLLRTRITENEKQRESCMRSSLIPQMMAGLLSHAIKQEKVENEKNLLNLQIRAREQAHILHNNGQFEEEIEFIKKEIEFCDLDSYYYRYWTILLKKRMLEYEQKQKSNTHSLLVSQIISGLLNHAMQQEIKKEVSSEDNIIEGLYPSNIKENEDNNNQIDSADNNMWEYSTKDSYESEAGNNNHPINKVPYWEHTYVYSASYLENANQVQKQFYNHFKEEFLKGHYLNIEDNSNYAFVLMFDLCDDYKKHKDYDLLKLQLDKLAENYPVTARYTSKTLLNSIAILNQEETKNKLKYYNNSCGQLCQWVTPTMTVKVQGFNLTRGNFYIGECFLLPNYIADRERIKYDGYKESYIYGSVLDPKITIKDGVFENYVPFSSYKDMSPYLQYEYLMWLSEKRNVSNVSIEILLFYLYGLEIRMFIDPQTNIMERKNILIEAIKLYNSLEQQLFRGDRWLIMKKLGDFIGNVFIKYFRDELYDFDIKYLLRNNRLCQNFYIYSSLTNENVLSSERAFDIACEFYDIDELIPKVCKSIAKRYFIDIYDDNIKGLNIDFQIRKTEQSVDYHYCNCCFYSEKVDLFYQIDSLPLWLWTIYDAIEKGYWNIKSRFRTYNQEKERSSGKETLMAILFLPPEVRLQEIPAIQELVAFIDNEMQTNCYLIKPIDWLLDLFEFKRRDAQKIYISYIDSLISGLQRMGFGIVPDYTVDNKKFSFGDVCVIYRNEEGYPTERTLKYKSIELFIKLASYVVLMDKVLEDDFDFVEQQVSYNADTVGNRRHLTASVRWRFSSKKRPSIDKQIRNAIEALTNEQCTLMGNALIRLACVDGDVHPKRIDGLKKILPLLGIEINNIHSQIHRILTDGEGFATIEKKSGAVEFVIGTEIEKGNNHIDTNIILNSEKLHIFEQQTKNAQELLSEIFVDEDIPTSQNTIDNTATDKWKDVLTLLLSKEKWERKEIENRCQEMGLMLGAVLEQINDFAYDKVDDVVVEDDGEYLYVTLDYKENLI